MTDNKQKKEFSISNSTSTDTGGFYGISKFLESYSKSQQDLLRSVSVVGLEEFSNVLSKSKNISYQGMSSAIEKINKHQLELVKYKGLGDMLTQHDYFRIFNVQLTSLAIIQELKMTSMLSQIQDSLLSLNVNSYISSISTTFNKTYIETPDIAYLKKVDHDTKIQEEIRFPKGFRTALDDLNISTALRISSIDDISFNTHLNKFFVDDNPNDNATSKELNVICSGADIIDNLPSDCTEIITESELISFLNILDETPTFAANSETGQKIHAIVEGVASSIGFDYDLFYHARWRQENSCPYPFSYMLNAPAGITGPGRYNYPGRAYYYFSDKPDGAMAEVEKHYKGGRIQIAEIRPIPNNVRLLDLSGSMRGGTTFLRYLRFPLGDINATMPREYLIPCYISDCCRRSNLNGIKYYGGANYSNYVSWNSGYFEFVRMV